MITFGVVTPSLNQCRFLPQAVESVINQKGYYFIDYLVLDGGSTDSSINYLKSVQPTFVNMPNVRFSWYSRKDAGQYAALQEGFSHVNGDVLCWLNSDDMFMPWAFSVAAEIFANHPQVKWITSVYPMTIDEHGAIIGVDVRWGYSRKSFRKWMNLPNGKHYARYFIQQDCTFWRRELWEIAGARLETSLRLAADYELWLRFFDHAELYSVASPLAGYRLHANQKTSVAFAYEQEAARIMRKHNLKPCARWESWVRKGILPVLAAMGLSPAMAHTGAAEPVQVFKHGGRGKDWKLVKKYIF